ncbi:MAG TPA: DUF1206 domain-containing protein [Pyrinomonadaceae bacterium]|jgi:hypothetical protein
MGGADVSLGGAGEKAEQKAGEITRAARPWIERLARFGYAAKGVVYVLVGSLAALGAFKGGDGPTDSRGALTQVVRQPYGRVMLAVVAAGLAGYALWRLVQALRDTEDKGAGWKGYSIRFGYACIGFVYAGLSYSAVQLILGHGAGKGSDQQSREWTATFFALPLGRLLVGLAGLGIIGFGLFQCSKAFTAKFRKKWKRHEMSERARSLATRAGQVGLAARGVVFGIIGIFLIQAALRHRAEEARGLSGALHALEQQPYGPYVLGAVALGLVAYGLYMFVEARFRRMRID